MYYASAWQVRSDKGERYINEVQANLTPNILVAEFKGFSIPSSFFVHQKVKKCDTKIAFTHCRKSTKPLRVCQSMFRLDEFFK
ncbi:hypothetical protein GMES_1079 [Paraglaciecola mesophila KMM 241]|uniref:Uncharacterized protein n=1 Tax=Paraglaciecola mesophila KMM 241 TaxID=1128912 RepID=K6Z314_9ALTE|nr:hypothetical protein GMES_1079 [Paraglaciecola mesophila KMM 241]